MNNSRGAVLLLLVFAFSSMAFAQPAAPVATAASGIQSNAFTANWNASAGANKYYVDVATDASFLSIVPGYDSLNVGNVTTKSVTGLSSATVYYYRVYAGDDTSSSAASNTVPVLTFPGTPTAISPTGVSTTGFTARWNSVTGASSYRLDVATDSMFTSFVSGYNNSDVGNVTSSPVSGLTAGTRYFYRVRAANIGGSGPNSNTIAVLTFPAAPTANVASNFSQTAFRANWSAVTSAGAYQLDVATDNGFTSFVSGYNGLEVGTTFSDVTGLVAGSTYYYRVRAVNSSGASGNSNTITTVTVPPAPVAIAGDSVASTGFRARWNVAAGAVSYTLDVATDAGFASMVSGYPKALIYATTYAVGGLVANTPYHYRLRAVNASGTSTSSNSITLTTLPPAPTALSASGVLVDRFTANWTTVAGATSYRLDVATDTNFTAILGPYNNLQVFATNQLVSGLSANTKYYYRVRAEAPGGTSSNSNVISQVTVLAAPVATSATTVHSTSLTANWGSVTGATGYRLDVSTVSNFLSYVSGYQNKSVAGLSDIVTGLAANTLYYYRVRAENAGGTSDHSNIVAQLTAPAAPTATSATNISNGSFSANWGLVAGATSYKLDVSTDSLFAFFFDGFNNLDVGLTNTTNVTGLVAGTRYFYRVRAATLAVVDEGLLDLTRFKAPDPWNRFYAREALGVRTWDLYDDVMGAFGSRIERLLAIGGDAELSAGKEDDTKANRFKPVVKFLGPFTLQGGSNEHRFIMPQYIGSVKTMVVAGYEGAYGKAEKVTPVRKPLMVLATLPRVLGPEEKLKLPVTLFSMEKSIRQVKIEIKAAGPLQVASPTQTVEMVDGDMTVEFDLAVKSALGVGRIEVTATSGSYSATDIIEIDIRNPNPPVTTVQEVMLEAGKTWNNSLTPIGMTGTNSALLEVSNQPPVNLGQRMRYLLQYPHGCIEQTTSAVFPQLYLDQVKALSESEKVMIQNNVKAGIDRLKLFITRDGGFAYWPGGEDSESWAATYAGHFLLEAEKKGYVVPADMLKRWKKYERNKAQTWRLKQESQSSELIQAYRLYALALAGDPELGAMNRLLEQPGMPTTARWMLAAAYVKSGQPEAGKKLIENLPVTVKPYQEMSYSYGSDLRDKAIILETLLLLQDRTRGFILLKDISNSLSNSSYWMSTQTVAWCLKAVGAFASTEQKGELKFSYSYNGKDVSAKTELPIAQVQLPVDGIRSTALKVVNESKGVLFVRVISEGIPARGNEEEAESNLKLSVSFTDSDGIPIDPGKLEQGVSFLATVSVINPGMRGDYKNLVLNQIFPSGWEINNLRLEDAEARLTEDLASYQDIRDDRVHTYFDLAPGQRKSFTVLLTASYAGAYYMPAVSCEAMYDHGVYARKRGQVIEVLKRIAQ